MQLHELEVNAIVPIGVDVFPQQGGNPIGGLVGHQAHADLRHRTCRKHGLCALARVSREDPVHVARWARPEALERSVAVLAARSRRPDLLCVLLGVEGQGADAGERILGGTATSS